MRTRTLRVILAAGMTGAVVCSAFAGGSVAPEEVMAIAKTNSKLNKELRGRAKGQPIECTTARVGRSVAKDLGLQGGARVGNSYECKVGASKLELSVPKKDARGRAKGGALQWKWTD